MKKWIHQLMTGLLVFTLFFGSVNTAILAEEAAELQEESNAIVEVDVSEYEIEDGDTAFDLLVRHVGEENVEYDEYPFGKLVHTINEVKAEDPDYWAFYINGISAPVGADSYTVEADDTITFLYVDQSTEIPSVTLKVFNFDEDNLYPSTWPINYIGEPTAFDLVKVSVGRDNLGYDEYDFGNMITSIYGVEPEEMQFWSFFLNGNASDIGASNYLLQPNDEIVFQLTEFTVDDSDDNDNEQDNNGSDDNDLSEETPELESIDPEVIQGAIDSASDYLLSESIGDWAAIALSRAGKEIPDRYLEQVKETLKENNGEFRNITDYERITLGILAAGGNPTNIEGYNLVEAIYNGNLTRQGLNGVVYGLIALDSANFETPDDAEWDRDRMITHLLAAQNEDGGWSWDGGHFADVDTTAMVMTALAPYESQSNVEASIEAALNYIEDNVALIDNSSTAAQVIIALASIGEEANQFEFEKNGESLKLVDYLLSYQNEDGGFYWKDGYGSDSDVFSTDQALRSLVAYQLFLQEEEGLYHLPLADGEVQYGLEEVIEEEEEEEEELIETPRPQEKVKEDNGGTVDPTNGKKTETTSPSKVSEKTSEGERLPDTATNTFNFLFIGFVLLLIGVVAFIISKKRREAMK